MRRHVYSWRQIICMLPIPLYRFFYFLLFLWLDVIRLDLWSLFFSLDFFVFLAVPLIRRDQIGYMLPIRFFRFLCLSCQGCPSLSGFAQVHCINSGDRSTQILPDSQGQHPCLHGLEKGYGWEGTRHLPGASHSCITGSAGVQDKPGSGVWGLLSAVFF